MFETIFALCGFVLHSKEAPSPNYYMILCNGVKASAFFFFILRASGISIMNFLKVSKGVGNKSTMGGKCIVHPNETFTMFNKILQYHTIGVFV